MKEFTTDMLEQIVGIEYPAWCLNYRCLASRELMKVIYTDLIKEVLTSNDIFIRLDEEVYGVPFLKTEPIKNIKSLDEYILKNLIDNNTIQLISVRNGIPFTLTPDINVISASSEVKDEVIALAKKVASKYNQDTIFKVAKQKGLMKQDISDYKAEQENELSEYISGHNYCFVQLLLLRGGRGGKISFDGQEVCDKGKLATWRVELTDSSQLENFELGSEGGELRELVAVAASSRKILYEDLKKVGLVWSHGSGTDVSFYANDQKMRAFFGAYDSLVNNMGMKIISDKRGDYKQQQLVKQL